MVKKSQNRFCIDILFNLVLIGKYVLSMFASRSRLAVKSSMEKPIRFIAVIRTASVAVVE